MTKYPWCFDPPRGFGLPLSSGRIRSCPEDFLVFEEPVCEPEGEGEHSWLKVRKKNVNTNWQAGRIARHAGVAEKQVSYAGLKDRLAVTEQWFSVHLPGRDDIDWSGLDSDECLVLESKRHRRKLRRGALKGNRFVILVRELQTDPGELDARLAMIKGRGIPNYFGPQRFGINGQNIDAASRLLSGKIRRIGRHKRGIYLSAARALLFNRILAERITRDTWQTAMAGDILQLDGKRGRFLVEEIDDDVGRRLERLEVHPTGPLWGKDSGNPGLQASEFEQEILQPLHDWQLALESAGLEQDRRPLRARVSAMSWDFRDEHTLELRFFLPAGSYATALLREILTMV